MEHILEMPIFAFDFRRVNWLNLGYKLGIVAVLLVLLLSMAACSTTWIVDLETYLPVVMGIATGVTSIIVSSGALGPAVPAEVQAVETAVSTGLTLLCGTPVGNQCSPTSLAGQFSAGKTSVQADIQATLASVEANISTWLSLIHIKNGVLEASISAALSLALSTITAIIARIGTVVTAAAVSPRAAKNAVAKLPKMPLSVSQVKAQYNSIVTTCGWPQNAIK